MLKHYYLLYTCSPSPIVLTQWFNYFSIPNEDIEFSPAIDLFFENFSQLHPRIFQIVTKDLVFSYSYVERGQSFDIDTFFLEISNNFSMEAEFSDQLYEYFESISLDFHTLPKVMIMEINSSTQFTYSLSIELYDFNYYLFAIVLYSNLHFVIVLFLEDSMYLANDSSFVPIDDLQLLSLISSHTIQALVYYQKLDIPVIDTKAYHPSKHVSTAIYSTEHDYSPDFVSSVLSTPTSDFSSTQSQLSSESLSSPINHFDISSDQENDSSVSLPYDTARKYPFTYLCFIHLSPEDLGNLRDLTSWSAILDALSILFPLVSRFIFNAVFINRSRFKEFIDAWDVNNFYDFVLETPLGRLYQEYLETETLFDFRYIEYLVSPICDRVQFGFVLEYFIPEVREAFPNFLPRFTLNPDLALTDGVPSLLAERRSNHAKIPDVARFFDSVSSYVNALPDFIRDIPLRLLDYVNQNCALVFLGGYINYVMPVGSAHLEGTMYARIRRIKSGFLKVIPSSDVESTDLANLRPYILELMTYLISHNPFYEHVDLSTVGSLSQEDYDSLIFETIQSKSDGIALTDQTTGNGVDLSGRVRISFNDPNRQPMYVPLEDALAILFPLLFPNGKIRIPGKTIGEKSKYLLESHPWFRQGKCACSMILFLFDLLERNNSLFLQKGLHLKSKTAPSDGAPTEDPIFVPRSDPAFPYYWYARNSEICAICEQIGCPDLMLTFTLNNKWPEVKAFLESNSHFTTNSSGFDLQFAPVDGLFIWQNRFENIYDNNFKKLISRMGLGECENFVLRLEFQGRGAPHVHALVWLKELLTLERISNCFSAQMPPDITPLLKDMVRERMVHKCVPARCDPKNKGSCKYGYPKPPREDIHIDIDGRIQYPRNPEDSHIVEYSPYLIEAFDSHAHVHVLKTDQNRDGVVQGVNYVLKYNFKSEPNMQVEGTINKEKMMFDARVVGVEEAVARIFSFRFVHKSIPVFFLDTLPEDQRKVRYDKNGNQMQLDVIEKYFNRPNELDGYRILDFYSLFSVVTSTEPQPSTPMITHQRPANSLANDDYESTLLKNESYPFSGVIYRNENLITSSGLKAVRRSEPMIVSVRKFSFEKDLERFYFHLLLISGCWRSEEEMFAGKKTALEALHYHGIRIPEVPETNEGAYLFIEHMLKHEIIYSLDTVAATIIAMLKQGAKLSKILEFISNQTSLNRYQEIKDKINEYTSTVNAATQKVTSLQAFNNSDSARNYISCKFTETEINAAQSRLAGTVRKLNAEQINIYNSIISRENIEKSFFINGAAGTGKTFLLNALKDYFISKNIPFAVTATTGIAALLVNGRTLHSTLAITEKDGVYVSSLKSSNVQGAAIAMLSYLFIDEVSMLSSDLLDCVNRTLRSLIGSVKGAEYATKPFGGVRLILSGDMAQVPAVLKQKHTDVDEAENMFVFGRDFGRFLKFSLDKVVRVDPAETEFLELLGNVRNCEDNSELSAEDNSLLLPHFVAGNTPEHYFNIYQKLGENGLAVYYTNRGMQEFNNAVMQKLFEPAQISTYEGVVIKHSPLSHTPDKPSKYETFLATPLQKAKMFTWLKSQGSLYETTLHLAVGCRVMLLKNIDSSQGLVNGRRGKIKTIYFAGGTEDRHVVITVTFTKLSDTLPEIDYPIIRQKLADTTFPDGTRMSFHQFPLKLCYAVTAHKVQGQTLEKVAICIGEDAFAHGAFYVALSRVHKISDLILFGLEEYPEKGPSFHVNRAIQGLTDEMRNAEFVFDF